MWWYLIGWYLMKGKIMGDAADDYINSDYEDDIEMDEDEFEDDDDYYDDEDDWEDDDDWDDEDEDE